MISTILFTTLLAFAVNMPSSRPLEKEKDKPKPAPATKRSNLIIPPETKVAPPVSGELFYHPGVVTVNNGRWIGSDNFVNIAKSMSIQVNIVKPDDFNLPISVDQLQKKLEDTLTKGGISFISGQRDQKPPLPLFSMQLLIYPVKDGFAAACIGRLFEEVKLDRVRLENETIFQAITWEQVNLVVGPNDQFEKLIQNTLDTISNNFVKRLASYQTPAQK